MSLILFKSISAPLSLTLPARYSTLSQLLVIIKGEPKQRSPKHSQSPPAAYKRTYSSSVPVYVPEGCNLRPSKITVSITTELAYIGLTRSESIPTELAYTKLQRTKSMPTELAYKESKQNQPISTKPMDIEPPPSHMLSFRYLHSSNSLTVSHSVSPACKPVACKP